MATTHNWKKVVYDLRKSAGKFLSVDNDAALMRCRKSMEAIQYSIFEEINGELPSKYLVFDKMMGDTGIRQHIPTPVRIDFQTVHQWGNYGCHWQNDGEPNETQVESALSALDSLIEWRFDDEKPNRNLAASSKPAKSSNKELLIKLPFIKKEKRYNVNNLIKYLTSVETYKPIHKSLPKALDKSVTDNLKTKGAKEISKENTREIETIHLLTRAIELSGGEGNNWARLSDVGIRIREIDPNFKLKETGRSRLELLFLHHRDNFEIKKKQGKGKSKMTVYVRIRKPMDN